MILYLHGFRSSPQSFKAQLLRQHMEASGRLSQWRCPALPVDPAQAIALAKQQAQELARTHERGASELTIIGSSLGGFYATHLAEKLDCKAILLNPAVYAPRDLVNQVGVLSNYHTGESMEFTTHDLDNLSALSVPQITRPQRYFLIAATGDALLDWKEMRDYYQGSHQKIVCGSDHGLSGFEQHIPDVMAFAYPDREN